MKKQYLITLMLCLSFGFIRLLDFIFLIDPQTGFAAGGAVIRYLLFIPVIAAAFLLQHKITLTEIQFQGTPAFKLTLYLCCIGALFSIIPFFLDAFINQGQDPYSHHAPSASQALFSRSVDILCIVLLFLLAVWFVMVVHHLTAKQLYSDIFMIFLSIAATFVLLIIIIREIMLRSASAHRITIITEELSLVFTLIFCMLFAKTLLIPHAKNPKRLTFWGMLTFFSTTCLLLPQAILLQLANTPRTMNLFIVFLCSAIGILGAVCSWQICCQNENQTS